VLASLARPRARRQMLALTAAVFLVFCALALCFYQAMTGNRSAIPKNVAQTPSDETDKLNDSSAAVGTGKTYRASFKALRHVRRAVSLQSLNSHNQQKIVGARMNSSSGGADSLPVSEDDSQPMLRIEFQTSDPNIRIIWFAPSRTDSHQSKPATD